MLAERLVRWKASVTSVASSQDASTVVQTPMDIGIGYCGGLRWRAEDGKWVHEKKKRDIVGT